MAIVQNFRSAFNGFNREDVVRYLEYLNTKHTTLVNQLQSENQALLDELTSLREASELSPAANEYQEICQTLEAERDAALAELATLREQLAQNIAAVQKQESLVTAELEAYRRAERTERAAKERAAQLYRQATGTLAEATTHVDAAADQFRQIADRVNAQMHELQAVVDCSKTALMDASATLYAIRPEEAE